MLNVCVAACLFRQPVVASLPSTGDDDNKTPNVEPIDRVEANGQAEHKLLINNSRVSNSNSKQSEPSVMKRECFTGLNFECSLFKVPRFSMWTVSFCFCVLGYSGNFTMIPAHVQSLGYDKDKVVIAMSVLGVSELVARVSIGWLADRKLFPLKYIFITSMLVSGVAAICLPFFSNFVVLVVYSAIVGIFPGSFWSLISVLIIESVGLEKLSPGFGLVSVALAIGAGFSQPVVGKWIVPHKT